MDGIMRCSRYSFGPNRLHYCGPDANAELRDLIESKSSDWGLQAILKKFKTLYPYLKYIARENAISDPFDPRVVEAYWLGNRLLERVQKRNLYNFMIDDLRAKDKMKTKNFSELEAKVAEGALPHHSFHVLNIWQQKGLDLLDDLERVNECRISSGEVTQVNGPEIIVSTEPLVFTGGKMALGEKVLRTLVRQLQSEYDIEQIKPGQIVSIHWGVPCEVITLEQEANLRKYNLKSIEFANMTL